MGDILTLPGVFRPDLEQPSDPRLVLASAMDLPIRDLVYVARKTDGNMVIGFTQPDIDAAVGLLMRGVQFINEAEQMYVSSDEIG